MLTVSCSPNFAQKWLVPRLGGFYDDNPSIDLRISASPQHVTFDGDGIDAAVSAQGIALTRSALVGLDLAAGRLVRPLANEHPAEFAYWIVCPHAHAMDPKIVRFREWLIDQAGGSPTETSPSQR